MFFRPIIYSKYNIVNFYIILARSELRTVKRRKIRGLMSITIASRSEMKLDRILEINEDEQLFLFFVDFT